MMSGAAEKNEASPACGLWCLPDEIALDCFARVSRLDRAALSMASKSYRSVVVSPELYETRSRMGYTEEYVYVLLNTPLSPSPHWFFLRRGKGKSRLVPIPSFPTPGGSALVALGSGIYVIGGLINGSQTSVVSFLDCRTHTWRYVPNILAARAYHYAGVLDGKIYVSGGFVDKDTSNWAEVFDPKMQTWSRVLIPKKKEVEVCRVDGREWDSELFYFRGEEDMWNDCPEERLLYCADPSGNIVWCDPVSGVRQGRMVWRKVYGLDDLKGFFKIDSRLIKLGGEAADVWHCYMLKHGYGGGFRDFLPGIKLTNSGGNIVIFWDLLDENRQRLEIWCAEISVERCQGGHLWGTVLWYDAVFSIDPLDRPYRVLYSVTVNV